MVAMLLIQNSRIQLILEQTNMAVNLLTEGYLCVIYNILYR